MASILGDNLVDDLLPVVDDIRDSLLDPLGARQYTVKLVRRIWTGAERGEGDRSDIETEITPPPLVDIGPPPGGLHYELRMQGKEEEGMVKVSEISLARYQEDDLTGGTIPANEEFYWVLEDRWGQGIRRRAYMLGAPPISERIKSIGWVCYLRRADGLDDC